MDNRTRLELYGELLGMADSLDEHTEEMEVAAKLRETADRIAPNIVEHLTDVQGTNDELFRIIEAIISNDGRLTADSSADLDLWQEHLEEWFKLHDDKIAASTKRSLVSDENLNKMAQYLYEGINITPDVRLVMDMTSKATLVRVLRTALIRAGIISDRGEWVVAMLHLPDCTQCEQCADLAVDSARATGRNGGSWQLEETMPDGVHTIMHRAVVERKS